MAALAAMCAPSFAAEDEDAAKVTVGGRINMGGTAEMLGREQSERSAGRVWVFQKQSRLTVSAKQGDTKFFSQLALGGEDVYTSNVNLTLLDMYAHGPLTKNINWHIGQFRNPYGRELMSESGSLAFNSRSITENPFKMGRDVGAMLEVNAGPAKVLGGVMVGGGRDVPERYIPEILGIPQLTLRATIGDADSDPWTLSQHDNLDTLDVKQTLGVSALYTRDTLVGHGLVLTNKNTVDKNWLINPAYNPYLSKKDANGHAIQGELWQGGVDYAVRAPFGGGTLSGEAEVLASGFHNVAGDLTLLGGRAQAQWNMNPVELALRYAVVVPDKNMAATSAATTGPTVGKTTAVFPDAKPIQEITPALSYFVMGDKLKLTVDMPFYFDAPIVYEKGLGSYNLINQPDQTSYITTAGNSIERQFVYQLRGSIQYAF
ncbi:MAG TPA: hypothetical protein V6D05_02735 [Stenomitos sp.]